MHAQRKVHHETSSGQVKVKWGWDQCEINEEKRKSGRSENICISVGSGAAAVWPRPRDKKGSQSGVNGTWHVQGWLTVMHPNLGSAPFSLTRNTRNPCCVARATSILSRSVGRCAWSNMHTSDKQLYSTNGVLKFCCLDWAPIPLIIRAIWAFQEGTHGIRAMCCVLCGFLGKFQSTSLSRQVSIDRFCFSRLQDAPLHPVN